MTTDSSDERSVTAPANEMAATADEMERKLDELGDHVEAAAKKAGAHRAISNPDPDDEAGDRPDVAGTADEPIEGAEGDEKPAES